MLIVFEGIDGSGKSTQLKKLADWFRERERQVDCFRDPGSTRLGNQIREWLLGDHDLPIHPRAEMMLFSTARTQLVEECLRPALQQRRVVLLDRYIFSTVVYQGYAGELDPRAIWTVNRIATNSLMPDLTLVFDLPVDKALARLGKSLDRMESRGAEYFERVRAGFLQEAEQWPTSVEVLDADRSEDELHQDVLRVVETWMNEREGGQA